MAKEYPKGLFAFPDQKDFIVTRLRVRRDEFIDWIKHKPVNDGYVSIDVLRGKDNKFYTSYWEKDGPSTPPPKAEKTLDDLPF